MNIFKLSIICGTVLFVGYQLTLVKATLDYIFGNKISKPTTFYLVVYMVVVRSLETIEFYIKLFQSLDV